MTLLSLKEFVRSVGSSRSLQGEREVVQSELRALRAIDSSPGDNDDRDVLLKLLFADMLGHDVAPLHLRAVRCLGSNKPPNIRRLAYLLCARVLPQLTPLRVVVVNGLLTDLASGDAALVAVSLTAVSFLGDEETAPIFLHKVLEKLSDPSTMVRREAVVSLHSLFMLDTGLINLVRRRLQLAVCDRDPSVMAATLPLLITALPAIKDIAADNYNSSLLCILQQILDSKLPRSFEYCGVSAPWVQIDILRALSSLSRLSESHAALIELICVRCIQQATSIQKCIGLAILCEAVHTLAHLPLLSGATTKELDHFMAKLLMSPAALVRFAGLRCLLSTSETRPSLLLAHQQQVLELMNHKDLYISRTVIDLLLLIANPQNITSIAEHILSAVKIERCRTLRSDLAVRLTQIILQHIDIRQDAVDLVLDLLHLDVDDIIYFDISFVVDTKDGMRSVCELLHKYLAALNEESEENQALFRHILELTLPYVNNPSACVSRWFLFSAVYLASYYCWLQRDSNTVGLLLGNLEPPIVTIVLVQALCKAVMYRNDSDERLKLMECLQTLVEESLVLNDVRRTCTNALAALKGENVLPETTDAVKDLKYEPYLVPSKYGSLPRDILNRRTEDLPLFPIVDSDRSIELIGVPLDQRLADTPPSFYTRLLAENSDASASMLEAVPLLVFNEESKVSSDTTTPQVVDAVMTTMIASVALFNGI